MPSLNENASGIGSGKAPLNHFAKHLFLTARVYSEKNKARENVTAQLKRMRRSIIKMRLSYSDIDRLKEKIDKLIDWERRYAKFFIPKDYETQELKRQLNALEYELSAEKEQKKKIIEEKDGKIREISESLDNLRNQARSLLMEKVKRHHKLRALEKRIHEKVDVHGYYHS